MKGVIMIIEEQLVIFLLEFKYNVLETQRVNFDSLYRKRWAGRAGASTHLVRSLWVQRKPKNGGVVQMAIIALASTTPELVPQFPSTLRAPVTPSTIGVMWCSTPFRGLTLHDKPRDFTTFNNKIAPPYHEIRHISISTWGVWYTYRAWSWCRPKKEDWQKKKDRNQRRPGCWSSQEDGGVWWAPVRAQAPPLVTHTAHAYHCHIHHQHVRSFLSLSWRAWLGISWNPWF